MEYMASPLLKYSAKELIFKCVTVYLAFDVNYTNIKYLTIIGLSYSRGLS